ncbi:MAG: J domain-containing protein [Verrucomicrobia bacterium]|nr:J domain-containing protein [Verrucomicrobiota bacterium]MBV9672513.1 J domain-containing protein [Verrucomicrobiota bacterium]
MAVQFRDYYETLGVSRGATIDEIKSAFRNLARKYHPDVAKDKKAGEEKFKEINEAYEVLSDPEKKRKYDELGANWQQGDQFQAPPQGWASGGNGGGTEFHFDGTGFSDFFEAFFGRRSRVGESEGVHFSDESFVRPRRDLEADIMVTLEEALNGSTRQISLRRSPNSQAETYTVKIPPGIREGQRIRLAGRGENGGDLFLRVSLERHPDFRVQDGDLYYDLELAPWEAVLGTQITIPTLGGRAKLKVPAGTQSGRKFRLAKQGLPRKGSTRGDLYAVTKIETPSRVSDKERHLWEELAQTSSFNPRQ